MIVTLTAILGFFISGFVPVIETGLAFTSVSDPGSGTFLTSGSGDPGWVKNQDLDQGCRSGMNISDHLSESLETIFCLKILTFFDVDPNPGSGIWDKHPGSATLAFTLSLH
jgi:hypothetical protein